MRQQKENDSFNYENQALKTANIINDKAKFISHEIKNNLSIINLYSKIADKNLEKLNLNNEQIQNALKNITNASENISYLISDLRCLSAPFKTEISLKNLVETGVNFCKIKIENANAKIVVKNIENINIVTDKVKVHCAITNIIFNALDANAKNIIIETDKNNILIINDGKCIPKNIQNKIFDDNFTTKDYGNGLGLAFCKKEMQTVEGDINLIKSDEKETVFKIKI